MGLGNTLCFSRIIPVRVDLRSTIQFARPTIATDTSSFCYSADDYSFCPQFRSCSRDAVVEFSAVVGFTDARVGYVYLIC